jgi:hypothetical protein
MRQLLQKYGYAIAAGLIVLAGILIFFRSSSTSKEGDPSKAFFVDEETNEEMILPTTEIPPLLGKGGKPTVVKAFKYTCGSPSDAKVYYFLKYTEEAQAKLKSMPADDPNRYDVVEKGELVRSAQPGSPWVRARDPRANEVKSIPECTPGVPGTIIHPR